MYFYINSKKTNYTDLQNKSKALDNSSAPVLDPKCVIIKWIILMLMIVVAILLLHLILRTL